MNFRRRRGRDEPEINLIPLIDLLLVILIFLMVSTTYSRFSELKINLPAAKGEASKVAPVQITVAVAASGEMMVNEHKLSAKDKAALVTQLKTLSAGKTNVMVVVDADGKATHQSVVTVMEAAREAGLTQLAFATRQGG